MRIIHCRAVKANPPSIAPCDLAAEPVQVVTPFDQPLRIYPCANISAPQQIESHEG
jgi:hypothetical protein